jgi:hypothetical protein
MLLSIPSQVRRRQPIADNIAAMRQAIEEADIRLTFDREGKPRDRD